MTLSEKIVADVTTMRADTPLYDTNSRAVVIYNLIWLHQVIVASVPLMELAASKSTGLLHDYFLKHTEEERNHAEWLANDLASVGIDVTRLPLYRSAVELAGSQYYFVNHVSPASLLGYMAVLEGFPVLLSTVEHLEQLHGKELLRCIRFHAEHDLDHRKELFSIIDQLDDPKIYENAIRTQYLMNGVVRVGNE